MQLKILIILISIFISINSITAEELTVKGKAKRTFYTSIIFFSVENNAKSEKYATKYNKIYVNNIRKKIKNLDLKIFIIVEKPTITKYNENVKAKTKFKS